MVGAGGITQESHLPVLKSLRDVEVTAICDQQVALAKSASSRFRIRSVYESLEQMLCGEKLDIVDICAPPRTHAQLAIQAMEHGCHVLTEKPLAISTSEADKMIASARKHNVKLGVVHQNLFNPVVIQARKLIDSGELGDILEVEASTYERKDSGIVTNPDHWCHKLPGGIFFEILPHPVYLVQSFLGGVEVSCVSPMKLGTHSWMKNDEVRVTLKGKKAVGGIVGSCNSALHGDSLQILGTKLAIQADLWGRTMMVQEPRSLSPLGVGLGNLRMSAQLLSVISSTISTTVKAVQGKASTHYNIISSFVESVRNDTEPVITAEQGKATVATLEDIAAKLD